MGDIYNLGEIDGIIVTELFNGNANAVDDYSLSDSILNYKYILLFACTDQPPNSIVSFNKSSYLIDVSDVDGNIHEYRIFQSNGPNNHYSIQFTFSDDNMHLHIEELKNYSSTSNIWTNSRIYKIIGIN